MPKDQSPRDAWEYRNRPLELGAKQVRGMIVVLAIVLLLWTAGVAYLFVAIPEVSTRLGAVGDWLAAGAFALALVASVVATLAYGSSLLKPDLRAELRFGHGVDGAVLLLDKRHDPASAPQRGSYVGSYLQNTLHIHLHNFGAVSARNPALKVKLVGMMFPPEEQVGWAFGDHFHGMGGFAWAQWDGGADFSIHPNWGRDLPILNLQGIRVLEHEMPAVQLEIVADGFSVTSPFPVSLRDMSQDGAGDRGVT